MTTLAPTNLEEILFPDVLRENWQMMPWERIALTGILSRLRPKFALEIGVYYGGSLSLTSQFAEKIVAVDIDPEVQTRFKIPDNVDLRIGNSVTLVPKILRELSNNGSPLNFVLIDADHSAQGVKRDIELVLEYKPIEPMLVAIHDSGNPNCRAGILAADWSKSPYVHSVECDFVPGQVIEHAVKDGKGEVWGGLALAFLSPVPRSGNLVIGQAARTSVEWIQRLS